jgi:protein-S-isoprenylcysteine O-methyltransferase Ste14
MPTITYIELLIFAFLSIIIIAFSWHVLFNVKAHGFYRFFAWEGIAWLAANNFRYWFCNAFSVYQIISWVLLLYATFLVVAGVILIKVKGKADAGRKDNTLYAFERTTELIESGLYKYIRHPLYGSLLFLAWGIYFKNVASLLLLIIAVLTTILLFATALIEEKENIRFFGTKYSAYIKRSKMFIPYIL